MQKQQLAGRRCMGLLRCSTRGQVENSIHQQRAICKGYADEHGMIWHGEARGDGVSGYQTEDRSDLDAILSRKRGGENFDVVVVQDFERLTRGGVEHGNHILWSFAEAGLHLVVVRGDIPDNEYTPIVRAFEFLKGRAYSQSTAFNTARGRLAAILDGRAVYCGSPPYGIDRLIFSENKEPLFRVRNMPDGTQQKLHATDDTAAPFAIFGRNGTVGEGDDERYVYRHFVKAAQEKVTLVPGDPLAVRAVSLALHWHYDLGWGAPTIAYELNKLGIPAAKGGLWSVASVFGILRHPIYTGHGFVGVYNEADIYHMSKEGPKRIEPGVGRYRDEKHWIVVEYPLLQKGHFLPPEKIESLYERQTQHMRNRVVGATTRSQNDRHRDSDFFLKGSIFTIDGKRMRGHRCSKQKPHRYYLYTNERPNEKDRQRRKLFPAGPAEDAVKRAIQDVIVDVDAIVPRLRQFVAARMKAALADRGDLIQLKSEKDALEKKIAFAVDEVGDMDATVLRQKIAAMKSQLRGVTGRIESVRLSVGGGHESVDEAVEAIILELKLVGSNIEKYSSPALRHLLSVLTRTTVNLDTREAQIEVRLPVSAAFNPKDEVRAEMCLTSGPLPNRRSEAQREEAFELAFYRCEFARHGRKPCLKCSRTARQAA